MAIERDPTDGKIAFFPAELGFEIETPLDVLVTLSGLRKAAEAFHGKYGFVGYPVLIFEQDEN